MRSRFLPLVFVTSRRGLCVLAIAFSVWVRPVHLMAQFSPGAVTVFADENGNSCTLVDDEVKTINVYVFNRVTAGFGLGAARFRLVSSPGFTATYTGETSPFVHVGNTQSGINVAYGTCLSGVVLVATVSYAALGTSGPCSYIGVTGHPQSYFPPDVDVMDCNFYWLRASTDGPLYINPIEGQCSSWCVVATRSTTWGAVKSLYH